MKIRWTYNNKKWLYGIQIVSAITIAILAICNFNFISCIFIGIGACLIAICQRILGITYGMVHYVKNTEYTKKGADRLKKTLEKNNDTNNN